MFEKTLASIRSAFRTAEIREKIIFSLLVIIYFRLLAAVPIVGISRDALTELFTRLGGIGDTISTVSGGVLSTASVVAIGLGPYINASIILQLLGTVIPKLEELRNEGSNGRRMISMYTRYLTVPLAILQSFVIFSTLRGFGLVGQLETIPLISMIATLTGGALLMMWIGELVTERGLGNGSSYLIFLGIASGIPSIITNNLRTADWLEALVFFVIFLLMIVVTIYVTEAERKITVMYSRRVRTTGTQENTIPMKLAQFGVMPVIFAISLLSFPQLIAQFLVSRDINEDVTRISQTVIDFVSNSTFENVATFLLVIAFSFFYITVVFNAEELAENLQKQGAFIPGIRPGKQTSTYLRGVSFKLTAFGALFLAVISVLPSVLLQLGILSSSIMSGTGLLIVIGVVLEIKRQIESMIVVRNYDKYL